MIRRIRLRNYKSFVDAELTAAPLTVIFGPNDSGKSNLLDALTLLSELAEVDDLKKAFDERIVEAFHSRYGFGERGLRNLQEQDEIWLQLDVDLELQPLIKQRINATLEERERLADTKQSYTRVAESVMRYTLRLRYDPRSGEPSVADEELIPLNAQGEPSKSRNAFIELDREHSRFVVRMEKQNQPRYYGTGRTRTLLSEISDPVYHPHIVAAKEELRSWRSYDVEPALVRREGGVHGADEPGRHGEHLAAFYWKLEHESPEAFHQVEKTLQSLVPTVAGIAVREVVGTLDGVVIERDGGEFPFRLASIGTLRLLCLLGIAVAPHPPAVVGYEEPESGVDTARIDTLIDVLRGVAEKGDTQLLLTTHSRAVLDRLHEAHFVACKREDARGSLFLEYREADKMFAADDLHWDV
jgi:predicted ATPase